MADVNVNQQPSSSGTGGSTWIVAVLVIIVLAVVLWFVFARGGGRTDKTDVNVDINVPGQTGGGGNPSGSTGR